MRERGDRAGQVAGLLLPEEGELAIADHLTAPRTKEVLQRFGKRQERRVDLRGKANT